MVRLARREPSALLLAAQLAGLLLYPFLEHGAVERPLLSVFGIAILGLVVLAVRSSPGLTWVSLLLAVPATVLLLIQAITHSDDLLPYSSALEAVLYFYAAGALIAYMLRDPEIRAMSCSHRRHFHARRLGFRVHLHGLSGDRAGKLQRGSDAVSDRSWVELLFLSFTTLTSVGLSDVTPVEPFARSLVMIEMICGVAFVGMLVSRVVGMTLWARRQDGQGRAESST